MKGDLSLAALKKPFSRFGHFFLIHNRMIYFVLFFCALSGAIVGLNLAINQPSDEAYRAEKLSETQSPRFDDSTIQRIQNLNARQQTNTDALPSGQRTNPFGE